VSRVICLHGPESTGKSTLAPRLAQALGGGIVQEFGRTFAEARGTEFGMADLVEIARTHDQMTRVAIARGIDPVILDTDPLMTAAWAMMLHGHRDPWFDEWTGTADLYLLFDIDLPWIDDGTRMFGTPALRRRFLDASRAELERRGLRWAWVRGDGEARFDAALAAIRAAGLGDLPIQR